MAYFKVRLLGFCLHVSVTSGTGIDGMTLLATLVAVEFRFLVILLCKSQLGNSLGLGISFTPDIFVIIEKLVRFVTIPNLW